MDLQKIYESLQLEKLEEEKQTEIKQYLDEAVDLKAKELLEEKLTEEKEKLVEHYETKFETYKEDITSKFSNFVDDILEQELQIPDKIKEYAKIGERYQPIMEKLKIMMGIDEGQFDDEAKDIIREARDEIQKLKDKSNKLISEKMDLEKDAKEMAAHIYLVKKCDGLTESKKSKVVKLLEGIKDKDEIDRKFKIITESYTDEVNEKTMYCEECDSDIEINEDDTDAVCPDCSGKLSEKSKGKTDEEIAGNDKPDMNEKTSIMDIWKTMIRENKY